ncbi:MAG: hypothetical protein K2V38_07020, partial [Gemmataceae bacterium]|nr:hypothetical protein [Gemmataceae bacterium]
YAAWLVENGNTYGDFIRLTIKIEALPEGDKERVRLEERRHQLTRRDGARWVRPFTDAGIYPGVHFAEFVAFDPEGLYNKFGVVEELGVPSNSTLFPDGLPHLFAAAPFLRKLDIRSSESSLGAFRGTPPEQLEELCLSFGPSTVGDVRAFALNPFKSLRKLRISVFAMDPEAVALIAQADWLAGVRVLYLEGARFGDAGAAALAASPNAANLEQLELGGMDLTDRGLRAVCVSPHLGKLETLSAGHNRFTAAGVRAIPGAAFAAGVKGINLYACGLGGEDVRPLLGGAFPALTWLDLGQNPIGDEALAELVGAAFFPQLETFPLHNCGAGDLTARALAALPSTALDRVSFDDGPLTDAGLAEFLGSPLAVRLKSLGLDGTEVGAGGLRVLAAADLPAVESLSLLRLPISRAVAKALARSKTLDKLESLYLSEELVHPADREMLLERFTDKVVHF